MRRATILVTGSTGTMGRALLAELERLRMPVRALVRDPQAATALASDAVEVVVGDFGDQRSVAAAMQGIERAFVLTPVSPDALPWCRSVFTAALGAGVDHLVKFSALGAGDPRSEILRQHGEADAELIASGLDYTILRPSAFFQNLLWQAEAIRATGQFFLPAGDARLSMVDVRDLAEAGARVLSASAPAGGIRDLTGPEALSYGDVADRLTTVRGAPVTYVAVPEAAAREAMVAAGMPPWQARAVAELQGLAATGVHARVTDDLAGLLGRSPRRFGDFAREHAAAFGA